MRVKPVICILAAGCLLISVTVPAALGYTVQPHPRMFINSSTIPGLKQRCQTTHAAIFDRFKAFVDDGIRFNRKSSTYVDDYALMAVITEDPYYINWAIEAAIWAAENNQEIGNEGGGPARISNVCLAYDWLYRWMTPAQRDAIALKLAPWVREHIPNVTDTAPWLCSDQYIGYGLALYGDGYADADAATGVANCIQRFTTRFIPAMNEVGTYGSCDGYTGQRSDFMFGMCELLRTSIGEDYSTASSFVRNQGDFWMHRLRGDMRISRTPGKWNVADIDLTTYFARYAAQIGNPYWQHLALDLISQNAWSNQATWKLLLWFDPGQPHQWPPDILSYHCTGSKMTYMRSDWGFGSSSTTIHSGIFAGPDLVHHKTQGHFLISRGSDNLIIDSGSYNGDMDDHYFPYYVRAIAHNTVLIEDPIENFGTYTNHNNAVRTLPNDGGQQPSDRERGCIEYPAAECTYGFRGEIERFTDTGEYVYCLADLTAAYSANKAQQVTREYVYVRPNLFVLRDTISRTNPSFKTKSVFHMIDRPDISGTPVVVHGNLATGGVYEWTGGRSALVSRGSSQCWIDILNPPPGSGVLRLVGGGNASGQAWKQNWEPAHELTYDPSTSYEFWIGDRNWISCSYYCNQANIDGRNSFPGNEAGDWRLEIEAPGGSTEVTMVTVLQVGALGAPRLPMRYLETPTAQGVVITRAPGDTLVVAFQRGQGLQEIRY